MDLHIELPELHLKNPIIPVNGCLGFDRESTELCDLSLLGGIAIKSVTPHSRFENPIPHVMRAPHGILNAIGLQSLGVDVIMERELPWLAQFDTETIANVAGVSEEEHVGAITKLNKSEVAKAYEPNVSCPNVKHGGVGLSTSPKLTAGVIRMIEEAVEKPVYVRLSPNVTNIVKIAKVVEEAGADDLVLIDTLIGTRMDLRTGKPLLASVAGGLSGPVIGPVAMCTVHQVTPAVNIPIVGVGGTTRTEDVLEFLYIGASVVEAGTRNFISPLCCVKIIKDLPKALKKYGDNGLNDAVGRSFH